MNTEETRIMSEVCFNNAQQAHQLLQYAPAEHWYNNTLYFDPDNKDVLNASIYPLALQRKYKEAIARATKVMEISDTHRDNAHYSRGLMYLTTNDYINGFKDFEIRLKQRPIAAIHEKLNVKPYWNGEPCKTLYVFGEQGFGDIIMFSRYLPLIKTKFKVDKIYFDVPKPCADLFKYNFRNDPEIEVISVRSTYELLGTDKEFLSSDYYIQQLSLARLFETTFDTVPPIHLEAEPEFIEKQSRAFPYVVGKKTIGIVCGGRPVMGDPMVAEWNGRRNVDQERICKILADFNIVSLEKEQNPEIQTWSDTAGLMMNCDLIVTVDSGPAHLAGALGCKTLLLNHFQHCWRFAHDGQQTPWYGGNFKQIRQKQEGNWEPVYAELAEKVKEYAPSA